MRSGDWPRRRKMLTELNTSLFLSKHEHQGIYPRTSHPVMENSLQQNERTRKDQQIASTSILSPHHEGELKLYWEMARMDNHLCCVTLDMCVQLTGKEKGMLTAAPADRYCKVKG
ncbi:uncharacterized protein VSU04_016499 [Chlamydotis macqueenii]